jgi:hypothetical protein
MIQALPVLARLDERIIPSPMALPAVLAFAAAWTGLTLVEFRTRLVGWRRSSQRTCHERGEDAQDRAGAPHPPRRAHGGAERCEFQRHDGSRHHGDRDAVLISHDHDDHLDLDSVRLLARREGGPPRFVVGLGLKH